MATITISSINWGNPPAAIQSITLEYKLYSDSVWTLIDNGVQVDTDGSVLDSPLPSVSGLTDGTIYYVRSYNECDSPIEYYLETINT
jgi:hypothetical protein